MEDEFDEEQANKLWVKKATELNGDKGTFILHLVNLCFFVCFAYHLTV